MPADLNMFNKIIINLATPTNDNDAENNSCVDCVKQAATLGFVPVYFFNYEMGHDNEKETKFKHQDQNMEFPMSHISQYEVTNERLMWMEHVNFISEMVTGCLQHISTIKDMILSDPFLTGLSNRIHTYRLQVLM